MDVLRSPDPAEFTPSDADDAVVRAGLAAAKAAAAALGGLPTPRRLGPCFKALPCGGLPTGGCAGSCDCRLPAGDSTCERLPCADSACARLPCRLAPACCAACGSHPDPAQSPSDSPWRHETNSLAVQQLSAPKHVVVQTSLQAATSCAQGFGEASRSTCTPDMSTPSSSRRLCSGWEPMPSGWLRLTSTPREPLPYRSNSGDARQGLKTYLQFTFQQNSHW